MSIPRRHHSVPQLLQRGFTDAEGRLFVLDKSRPTAGVFATTPSNAFVVRDLNTITEKDGKKDVALEVWYSGLEGEVAPIIKKIIGRARERKIPQLSDVERNVWHNFIYHQQKRAPDAFERLGLVSSFENDLAPFIKEFERDVRPLTDQERADLRSPATTKRMIQRVSVTARSRGSQEVIDILASRGIAIAVVTAPRKSFILGDHPLSRMGSGGRLDDLDCELWFPIAADVAVSPWGAPKMEKLLSLEGSQIRRVNEVIFKQSNIVASRSEVLLRSLARS